MILFSSSFASITRISVTIVAALAFILADLSVAVAQNNSCGQIGAILRSIETNPAFASNAGLNQELAMRQQQVLQGESQWVNGGCQQQYSAGSFSQQCQGLAQSINQGRAQVQQLQAMVQEGRTLVQNHATLSQDYQRYNCSAQQSGVTFGSQGRGSLLDGMFGGGQPNVFMEEPYQQPWSVQQTRRTVCVRTCDGFYWPISFSTTDDYVAQDAIQCHEMCPGTEVALFSYRNPGEEPEDMIALSGTPYRSMPYAFRFRTEIDTSCSCRSREPSSTMTLAESPETPSSFTSLEQPVAASAEPSPGEIVNVPLPRPRPGSESAAAEDPVLDDDQWRIVEFGDRDVRIVGPETPFVPGAAGEP